MISLSDSQWPSGTTLNGSAFLWGALEIQSFPHVIVCRISELASAVKDPLVQDIHWCIHWPVFWASVPFGGAVICARLSPSVKWWRDWKCSEKGDSKVYPMEHFTFPSILSDLLHIHPAYILLILFLHPVLLYLLKQNSGHVQTSRDLGAEALWKSQGVGDCAPQATHSRTSFFSHVHCSGQDCGKLYHRNIHASILQMSKMNSKHIC